MRQLSFLPNSTKAPTASEFAAQCFLVALIRRTISPAWRFTHIASGEYREKATAGRLYAMGVERGWPDLLFVGPSRVLFIELKRRGGKLSDAQQDLAAFIVAAGHDYLCTDNVKIAIAKLNELGVLRTRVEVQ
jgi:hypothetical protein